jgi:hypothetical protein
VQQQAPNESYNIVDTNPVPTLFWFEFFRELYRAELAAASNATNRRIALAKATSDRFSSIFADDTTTQLKSFAIKEKKELVALQERRQQGTLTTADNAFVNNLTANGEEAET